VPAIAESITTAIEPTLKLNLTGDAALKELADGLEELLVPLPVAAPEAGDVAVDPVGVVVGVLVFVTPNPDVVAGGV